MIFLILFSFIAGIITILSPCILPILPIVLAGGVGEGHKKPYGIVTGFVFSFTFFTLALASIVRATGLPAESLRSVSIVIIIFFGFSLLIPKIQLFIETAFSNLLSFRKSAVQGTGFVGGFLIGLSLGLVWTPCVGPIIASIITLAATSQVTLAAVFITLAYSVGTAIPMLAIIFGGRGLLTKIPWLTHNTGRIQKLFGLLMILTGISIYLNFDRKFQTYILEKFPNYGTSLIKLEDNELVERELEKVREPNSNQSIDLGSQSSSDYLPAPELIPGGQWFNSEPLTLAQLRGKVVLIDFWTYTCINCIRTLPYLNAWHEKYSDKGLVIIGVHTPEFAFEEVPANVQQAINDFGLKYPIVQDNGYATWKAYSNRYWPAKYFIDKNGNVRSTHFGEGDYDESEKMIQELLKEIGQEVDKVEINNPGYTTYSRTPETYLGFARIDNFASNENILMSKDQSYTVKANLPANHVAYNGIWNVSSEYANPQPKSQLYLNFESQEVFLVMRTKTGSVGRLKVYLDGNLVTDAAAGEDVKEGVVEVDQDRLYKLIMLPTPGRHLLRLEFEDDIIELYAFTFG